MVTRTPIIGEAVGLRQLGADDTRDSPPSPLETVIRPTGLIGVIVVVVGVVVVIVAVVAG